MGNETIYWDGLKQELKFVCYNIIKKSDVKFKVFSDSDHCHNFYNLISAIKSCFRSTRSIWQGHTHALAQNCGNNCRNTQNFRKPWSRLRVDLKHIFLKLLLTFEIWSILNYFSSIFIVYFWILKKALRKLYNAFLRTVYYYYYYYYY